MFWVHPYSTPHEAASSIATRPRRSASAASRLPCCLRVTPCFLQRDVLAPASRSRNAGRSGHYGEEPSESEAGPQAVQAAEQVGARALILPSLGFTWQVACHWWKSQATWPWLLLYGISLSHYSQCSAFQ